MEINCRVFCVSHNAEMVKITVLEKLAASSFRVRATKKTIEFFV
jgi:hypothetical protein